MRKSKEIIIGNVKIGGGNPIAVQSMLNIPADDVAGNVKQALELNLTMLFSLPSLKKHLQFL